MSVHERAALVLAREMGLPEPQREYRFHPDRRWRFDLAWPDHLVAAEIEGGVWVRGRHNRGSGFICDCEKYNAAAELGWLVIRIVPDRIPEEMERVERILKKRILGEI